MPGGPTGSYVSVSLPGSCGPTGSLPQSYASCAKLSYMKKTMTAGKKKNGTKIQMMNFGFLSCQFEPWSSNIPSLVLRRAETGWGGEAPHLCLWFSSTTLSLECERRWKDEVGGGGMGAAAEAEERERTKRPHLNIHQLIWWLSAVGWMEHEIFVVCVSFSVLVAPPVYIQSREMRTRVEQSRSASPASCVVVKAVQVSPFFHFIKCPIWWLKSHLWPPQGVVELVLDQICNHEGVLRRNRKAGSWSLQLMLLIFTVDTN